MAFSAPCALPKWCWQQEIFSGYLQGERHLRSVLLVFTLYWDLFSLAFFSFFPIFSDPRPGRIITCLTAIFNLTRNFLNSPVNVKQRQNIQGEFIGPTLCFAKIKRFLATLCFFSPPALQVVVGTKNLVILRLPQQMWYLQILFCRSLPLTFTPSWVPIWS